MNPMYRGKESYILGVNTPTKVNEYTHKKETCGECMGFFSDLTDWAGVTWKKVSGKTQELVDSVTSAGSSYYDEAVKLYNKGQENVDAKLNEAKEWVAKLKEKQREADIIIANTSNEVERQALIKKRDEARGIFSEYVLPLFDKLIGEEKEIMSHAGEAYTNHNMMFAALPLIPLAIGASIVSLSMAVIYYSKQAFAIESSIVNDSSLSASEKAMLITGLRETGSIQAASKALSSLSIPLVIGGIGFLIYKLTDPKK